MRLEPKFVLFGHISRKLWAFKGDSLKGLCKWRERNINYTTATCVSYVCMVVMWPEPRDCVG